MRRWTVAVLGPALLAAGGLSAAPGSASEAGAAPVAKQAVALGGAAHKPDLSRLRRWVPGQLLVQWSPRVAPWEARAAHAGRGATVLSRIQGFGGIDVVQLPPGLGVEQGMALYQRDPRVHVAEPNLLRRWLDHVPGELDAPTIGELWGLENEGQPHPVASWPGNPTPGPASGTEGADLDAMAAWAAPHSGEPVIAVVDSGVRLSHQDLTGRFWTNPAPGVDKDGCTHAHGCNFGPGPRTNLMDLAPGGGHGTHVAGTIAARHDNGTRAVGVCPQCRIMVVKFDGTLASELKALDYARRNGAQVVNGSFGGPMWSRLERRAIRRLHRDGILAVFAAGNDALDNDVAANGPGGAGSPIFPASYTLPNIVAVAASNHHDRYAYVTDCDRMLARWRCAFTNVGAESVDVAAPGADVLSAAKASDAAYRVYDGTSMAAPHVAGVAGLILSARPELRHLQVKNAIMNSVDRPTVLRRVWSFIFRGKSATGRFTQTGGRVDATRALTASGARPSPRSDGTIAGALRLRRATRGRVAYPQDANDVYRKRLRKGRDYVVRLRVPRRKDLDLWVWKPRTVEIWQFEAACLHGAPACRIAGSSFLGPGRDEVVRFRARTTGVHYFHVAAWYKHAARYRLVIRRA